MDIVSKAKDAASKVTKHLDTNKDGKVDAKDLQGFKKHADINKDGKVSMDDIKAIKNKFGKK